MCCISLELKESGHVRSLICMSTNEIGCAKERSSNWDGNSKPQDPLSVAVKRAVKRLYRTKGHMILVDHLLWQQTHLLVYTNVVHGQLNTSQYEKRRSTTSCLKRTLYKPHFKNVLSCRRYALQIATSTWSTFSSSRWTTSRKGALQGLRTMGPAWSDFKDFEHFKNFGLLSISRGVDGIVGKTLEHCGTCTVRKTEFWKL